ncbi:hypothetical protein BH11PSE9_BH11PSE9_21060 [soil metagenome]
MQDASQDDGADHSRPLTHMAYLNACPTGAQRRDSRQRPWVQLRKSYGRERLVLCGQVLKLDAERGEWFRVETNDGPLWVESRNVRLCSGDGRCSCEQCAPAKGVTC